jgi:SAM-dependent methyltransferase
VPSHVAKAPPRFGLQLGALAALCALWMSASANNREACLKEFQPNTGQSGKDVVWVPTNDALVKRMLTMADVKPNDLVYDLGAGDGKIAIAAARDFGARAVGVEYNPDMVKLAQCYAKAEGVANRVRIIQGDIFETDFSSATVVTLYLLPELNRRLRPTILKMKPGTRVVSHSFLMDDWEPDVSSSTSDGQAYFWIVPADVAGAWTFQAANSKERFEARITQTFQQITGTAGARKRALREAKLRGDQIQFTFDDENGPVKVDGRVNGNRIEAQVTTGGQTAQFVGTKKR